MSDLKKEILSASCRQSAVPGYRFFSGWRIASFFLILGYAAVNYGPFMIPVPVPDEMWFVQIFSRNAMHLRSMSFFDFLMSQKNELGYGSMYWVIPSLIFYWGSGHFLLCFKLLRLLAYLSALAVPITLFFSVPRAAGAIVFFSILLWMSQGMAWWYGKLVGPELVSMALGFIGTVFLMQAKRRPTFLLCAGVLGFAFGIKLTVLPLALFVGMWVLREGFRAKNLSYALLFSAGFFAGFVLANPFLVNFSNFPVYAENLKAAASRVPVTTARLDEILNSYVWTWESLPDGGLFKLALPPLALVIILAFCVIGKVSPLTILIMAASSAGALWAFAGNEPFFGWYFFPVATLPFILLTRVRRYQKYAALLLAAAAAVTILSNSFALLSYRNKSEHIKNIVYRQAPMRVCLERNLRQAGYPSVDKMDLFVDLSEIDPVALQESVPSRVLLQWKAARFLMAPDYAAQFLSPDLSTLLVCVGDRFKKGPVPDDVEAYLRSLLAAKSRGRSYQILTRDRCEYAECFFVRFETPVAASVSTPSSEKT